MKKHKKSRKRALAAQKEGKKGRRLSKGFWMSLFIVVIMMLSVVGFMWKGGSDTKQEYNGYDFRLTQNRLWQTEHSGETITFYHHPLEVEDLNLKPAAASSLRQTRMAYITSDPDDSLKSYIGKAEFEMKRVMEEKGTFLEYAFTGENEFNKTVITCGNATTAVPVIYIRSGNKTGISYSSNCLVMEAESPQDVLAMRDRLLYAFLGVIG